MVTYELDSDTCVGSNRKTAKAIGISIRKLDSYDESILKRIIHGVSVDASGGGTDNRLAYELRACSRLVPENGFFSVTCCLHSHSLTFKLPVEKYFLLGSVSKRTLLQLFAHNIYSWKRVWTTGFKSCVVSS